MTINDIVSMQHEFQLRTGRAPAEMHVTRGQYTALCASPEWLEYCDPKAAYRVLGMDIIITDEVDVGDM